MEIYKIGEFVEVKIPEKYKHVPNHYAEKYQGCVGIVTECWTADAAGMYYYDVHLLNPPPGKHKVRDFFGRDLILSTERKGLIKVIGIKTRI